MKTQKLSFNAISGVMSRSEMKSIMAGSGNSGGGTTYTFSVTCTAMPGYHVPSPGSCTVTVSNGGTKADGEKACQTQADSYCNNTQHCASCSA